MNNSIYINKKIIIVEDNAVLAGVIKQKLESVGAKVTSFSNGLEGLAAIRESQPDLVLLDIMLPVMNGYEVLQVMQSEGLNKRSKVIVLSNSGQPVEISRLRELGASDFLIKVEFTPEEVLEKAAALLTPNTTEADTTAPETDTFDKVASTTPSVPTADISGEAKVIKVFVVEDDPMLRNMLATKFSKSHCASMFTNDGAQAIELAKQYEPDIIILDLMLPGKDGFQILEEVKKQNLLPGIPIVVFSNKSEPNDKKRVMELGATAYHVKAMTDLNDLVAEIRKFVTQK